MGGIIDSVGDFIFGDDDASDASKEASDVQAKAFIEAANIDAASKQKALDYLKEREELPQQFREGALSELGGLYGLEGGTGNQQDLIDQAMNSPLYQALMGSQELGEEAIMRNASVTGGLRSGNVQGNMYDYITQMQNRALLASYNEQLGGLQGLAGLPSNASQIASTMAGVGGAKAQGIYGAGTAQSQGILGAAQTDAAASQQRMNTMLGIGGTIAMFSDRRLKKNIIKLGTIKGFNFYSFDWNILANQLGLEGSTCGCMADEVYKTNPKAVFLKNDFMMVNYTEIGVL